MSGTDNGNPSDTDKRKSDNTVSDEYSSGESRSGESRSSESRSDNPGAGDPDAFLSAKARAVKKLLQEGRYKLDLNSLAERLVDQGLLDDEQVSASELPLPQSGEAQNDEKPSGE